MTTTPPPKRRRRRFLQFSLRALLVFVLLVSIGMSWFAVRMEKARKQREAVEAIQKAGGWVRYDECEWEDPFAPSGHDPSAQSPVPEWARALLGDDFFFDVVVVSVFGTDFGDDEATYLERLTKLEELWCWGTRVTDAGLKNIRRLDIKCLRLSATPVTDAGLEHLKGLTKLEVLSLYNTHVSDAGLEHLTGLTKLRFLDLSDTQVTPEGVKKLQEALPDCRIVY